MLHLFKLKQIKTFKATSLNETYLLLAGNVLKLHAYQLYY